MDGFSQVFNESRIGFLNYKKENTIVESLFKSFRSHTKIYGFIHNCDNKPDQEANTIANNINKELFYKYIKNNENKKIIGYDGGFPQENAKFNELDSRHIMMSCILFTLLPEKKISTIVEIGAGFGNWLRLNTNIQLFNKWIMIDMPHLGELQSWCLKEYSINQNTYDIVSAFNYSNYVANYPSFDLVIGTHSLSEFSLDIFMEYFTKVLTKTKYFFYAYHKYSPNIGLINAKLDRIMLIFDLIGNVPSEQGSVNNSLFVNKYI